jgi:hypothetical protein
LSGVPIQAGATRAAQFQELSKAVLMVARLRAGAVFPVAAQIPVLASQMARGSFGAVLLRAAQVQGRPDEFQTPESYYEESREELQ